MHMADGQKWPEQESGRDEHRPMEESFEPIFCEGRKRWVRTKPLRRPKENWGKQCSKDNSRDKIRRQFSYVFQGG
jgi:hypothetical protein